MRIRVRARRSRFTFDKDTVTGVTVFRGTGGIVTGVITEESIVGDRTPLIVQWDAALVREGESKISTKSFEEHGVSQDDLTFESTVASQPTAEGDGLEEQ